MSTPMNFEDLKQALQKDFYVNVPFPIKHEQIEKAVNAFFKFLEEPEEIKTHINFSIAPQHRRGEVGFRHRDPGEHIYNDSKDFFHYHPVIFEKYADFLKSQPVVNDLVQQAKPIWDLAYSVCENILRSFETVYPDVCAKIFDGKNSHILLRFLKYHWHESTEYLAKPHFDAGSFTLAIAESSEGLRIGSCPENLKLVSHKPENAIFMVSSNYKKIMNTDEFSPGWHDVIQIDNNLIGKSFARWAVVVFIEGLGVSALPRAETHLYA